MDSNLAVINLFDEVPLFDTSARVRDLIKEALAYLDADAQISVVVGAYLQTALDVLEAS